MKATLILTIAPERDGTCSLHVSLRTADGTQGPPRTHPGNMDGRLADFITTMRAIARAKLAPIETSAIGRTGDGDPEAVHGE